MSTYTLIDSDYKTSVLHNNQESTLWECDKKINK